MIEITHNNSPASQQILSSITINILALLYSSLQTNRAGDEPGLRVIHGTSLPGCVRPQKSLWTSRNWRVNSTSAIAPFGGPSHFIPASAPINICRKFVLRARALYCHKARFPSRKSPFASASKIHTTFAVPFIKKWAWCRQPFASCIKNRSMTAKHC